MWPCLHLAVVCVSSITFSLLNQCFPRCLTAPVDKLLSTHYDHWRWRNIIVSLVHSTLSGLLALYLTWQCWWDWSSVSRVAGSSSGGVVLCISIGYFIYDTLLSWRVLSIYPGRKEIIAHHLITMVTLGCALLEGSPLYPYCVFGLSIEVNNIFIHVKSLLQLCHQHHTTAYRLNSLLVIASIIMFRFVPLCWIWHDLLYVLPVSTALFYSLSLPLVAIVIISAVILYRTIVEDFI